MTESDNPKCPDYSAHYENAADRRYPNWRGSIITWDVQCEIDAEAKREYLNCDGHQ